MKTNKNYLRNLGSGGFFPYAEHRRRQYGLKPKIGWESEWKRQVYKSLKPFSQWDSDNSIGQESFYVAPQPVVDNGNEFDIVANPPGYGGVFNLEFSPDGRLLAAACQKNAIVLFDPLTHRQTSVIPKAHGDCVNGFKFLDNRLFASCSDDQTVALWDARHLRQRVLSLEGHSKWVKNIEYHARDNLIITSGFDGDIISWDINRLYSDGINGPNVVPHERLFKLHGLMRTSLSPDLNKLLMCTSSGYILLLQNVDMQHLQRDLKAIKQLTGSASEEECAVVGRKRNRPVLIRDFPATNKAETIHSMQVHPQSWAVMTRNTSKNEESEWTCIHDIQEFSLDDSQDEDSANQQPIDISKVATGSASYGRGTLPSDAMDREPEEEMRGYYIVNEGNDSNTPRFEMLLDHRGGRG